MNSEEIPEKEIYLCNNFPRMERTYALYQYIKENEPIEQTKVGKNLNFEVDEPLQTLDLCQLISRNGAGLSTIKPPDWISQTCTGNKVLTFKLLLLHNLRKISGNELKWNIQAHVLLQHNILTKNNLRYFDTRDSIHIDMLNRELELLKYFPESRSGNPIKLNDKKFRYWKMLCSYLGIIKQGLSTYDVVLSFDSEIFSSIIMCFFNYDNSDKVGLKKLIEFISSEFLLVPLDRTRSPEGIYPLYGELFNYLHIKNEIELIKEGDEPYMYINGIPHPNPEFNGVKLL